MAYLFIGVGIVFIIASGFVWLKSLKVKDIPETYKARQKVASFLFIAGCAVIGGGWSSLPKKTQDFHRLSLNEFKMGYNKAAVLFNAPSIGKIHIEAGEKADFVNIAIAEKNTLKISVKKDEPKEIIGFVMVITSSDFETVEKIINIACSIVKAMEPTYDEQAIRTFVAEVTNDAEGKNHQLGKIDSSFKNMNVGAFWFIRYIDEND